MTVGDAASVRRCFTAEDVRELADLGGPTADPGAVPEPLIGALFSYLLGMQLPGSGANYLKQETRYLKAAPLDQTLTARVEITRLRPDKHLVDLLTTCRDAHGVLLAEGRALIYVADVASRA
ncbi:MAG: phosphate acetyltransferase [Caulobacteraceae bacterium]|nr:phosphate acetyltransferase [Caulobacteraceae bacterium]